MHGITQSDGEQATQIEAGRPCGPADVATVMNIRDGVERSRTLDLFVQEKGGVPTPWPYISILATCVHKVANWRKKICIH